MPSLYRFSDSERVTVISGKKQWLRISLRNLLIAFTCVAITTGWFAHHAQKRKAAFAAIRKAGGNIQMDIGNPSRLAKWFGPELFGTVNKVDLRDANANNELLTHIGVLTELQRLDLSGADVDDEGLPQIAHLPLVELWLQGTSITNASAATISEIRTLNFLQLNATSLSNDFLEHLQCMPALQDLGLRGTKVTGDGMKFLTRHPNLKHVDVYSTEVDDSGVRYLVDCEALTDVGLSMTKVTNDVFEYLDMLPNLTNADLTANRPITTEAVLAFEKSNPQCDIEWYGE